MKSFLRHTYTLTRAHVIIWLRTPQDIFISILLCSLLLLVGNHVFVFQLTSRSPIGIHSKKIYAQPIRNVFHKAGITTIFYDEYTKGKDALDKEEIIAFISYTKTDSPVLRLVLPGTNPLIDRQIVSFLVHISNKLSHKKNDSVRMYINNARFRNNDIVSFTTAIFIPFLIFALAYINCGMYWIKEWRLRTVYTFLATPVHRAALITAHAAAGTIISFFILTVTIAICRLIVPWPLPDNVFLWVGLLVLQLIAACAFFTFIAMICRSSLLVFVEVSFFLTIILMFISGTISPIEFMPNWLFACANFLPTMYAVRSMRAVMLGWEPIVVKDFFVILASAILFYSLSYILFTRLNMKK